MPRLTLENTFSESFREISDPDHAFEGFQAFNRRICYLGKKNDGRISEGSYRELICVERDRSEEFTEIGRAALMADGLFERGFSGIIMVGDYIDAVHDDPNPDPTLTSYGPGLMWASLKLAQERLSKTMVNAGSTTKSGYEVVNNALTRKQLMDVPYANRHHIGGISSDFYIYPYALGARRLEKAIASIGISGVLPKSKFHSLVLESPIHTKLASEAHETDALDGFTGNLFAGSIDSSLAMHVLLQMYGNKTHTTNEIGRSLHERVMGDIIRRYNNGINVH